jgi:hypothetical protein
VPPRSLHTTFSQSAAASPPRSTLIGAEALVVAGTQYRSKTAREALALAGIASDRAGGLAWAFGAGRRPGRRAFRASP